MNVSLSVPNIADPGLQLASPQNNLVVHGGAYPSRGILGIGKIVGQTMVISHKLSRHATALLLSSQTTIALWRLHWGLHVCSRDEVGAEKRGDRSVSAVASANVQAAREPSYGTFLVKC